MSRPPWSGARVSLRTVFYSTGDGESRSFRVKIQIVFLLAMIGQRLARNLPSSDTSTIREYRKKQGIHRCAFLKHI
jgi:hypothetical protein